MCAISVKVTFFFLYHNEQIFSEITSSVLVFLLSLCLDYRQRFTIGSFARCADHDSKCFWSCMPFLVLLESHEFRFSVSFGRRRARKYRTVRCVDFKPQARFYSKFAKTDLESEDACASFFFFQLLPFLF